MAFIRLLLASAIVATQAQAQTFKVLHTFHGAPNDGAAPWGALVRDGAGNFYGTTTSGGSGRGFCTNYGGCGTAFRFNKSGKETWLHSFTFPKGWSPETGLLRDPSGTLYGTTYGGGDTSCDSIGCGTVFALSPTGKETVLYKFKGSASESEPIRFTLRRFTSDGGSNEEPTLLFAASPSHPSARNHLTGQSRANWSGGTASCGVMPTSSTTNTNLVVFWATWTSTSMLTANVSDGFNSYLSAVGPTMQSATSIPTFAQLFYAKNIHGTANNVTVSFTGGSASTSGCVFVEYMGADTVAPLDSVSEAISNSGSPGGTLDSGTASPANANLLVFGGGTSDTGTAGTTGLPWSVVQNNVGSITEQLIVSGDNTLQRAPATSTASGNWLMQMAVFRGASWTIGEGSSPTRDHHGLDASQFPGSDIGAQINNAYAACPTSGCHIRVPCPVFLLSVQQLDQFCREW